MPKTITLRLDDAVYEEFREAATAEHRSIANLIESAALVRIREAQFLDDGEMAEIRSNEALQKRLRAGSADAAARRGAFVD